MDKKLFAAVGITLLFGLAAGAGSQFDVCSNQPTGRFFKDFSDCKGYIACVDGHSVYGSCPDKLLFNASTSACDYSDLVECNSCPRSGVTTFPLAGSCRKYVRCISGQAEYLECPSNLYYDKALDSCNLQANVDCTEQICENFGTYMTSSKEDCASYYECHNGKATLRQCVNGLYFNADTRLCDFAANVKCDILPPKVQELDDVTISCPPSGQHFYPHPHDCSHYYLCFNGVGAMLSCGPVLKYDIVSQNCNMAERATCITSILK